MPARAGWLRIGANRDVNCNRSTFDAYLKSHIKRQVADYIAVVLERARIVKLNRDRPASRILRILIPRDDRGDARAMIVAPATTNTINKWAAGISDTLPLGLLVEDTGKRTPIVAMPFTNHAQAAQPMLDENVARLRSWG